ncbi:MAG: HNH endonuclease [Cyanobacteria bacterium RU_5_0]|nr:HNH endonuclease [Cyanobacteria bacterium RU_5_0]
MITQVMVQPSFWVETGIQIRKGGSDDLNNLALACQRCK